MKADRVLVPLDGSRFAEMALPRAIGLLRGNPGATLILLRAVEAKTLPGVDPTEAQTAVVGEADAYLKAVAARLENETMALVVRSMWYCSAAKAIVEAARVRRVDMIVMSTHGRSGLRRLVRGSVAESVLRSTQTPILLVSAGGSSIAVRSGEPEHSSIAARGHLRGHDSAGDPLPDALAGQVAGRETPADTLE